MLLTVLIENSEGAPMLKAEHGLSLYVETDNHKILADTGASGAAIDNAALLGVNLKAVDTVFLSHGHYDHTGGLLRFCEENKTAGIYMQKCADGEFYNGLGKYIGIDRSILNLENLVLLDGDYKVDDTLEIFSGITGRKYFPEGNKKLTVKKNGRLYRDKFSHEQCAVIREDGKTLLISGCAHNGILNIIAKYRKKYGSYPSVCVSGFHMMKQGDYTEKDKEIIENTARELVKIPTKFYTGHCTHDEPFEMMKKIMGDKLEKLSTGKVFEI